MKIHYHKSQFLCTSYFQFTQYTYNDTDRTVTVNYGDVYTTTWLLNAWGETIKHIDGEGNEKHYVYNSQGQLITVLFGQCLV